jgi:hypothetical protein
LGSGSVLELGLGYNNNTSPSVRSITQIRQQAKAGKGRIRQDKTIKDNTRHHGTRQDRTGQGKTRQDRTRQDKIG